ncbi:MAG TPA: polysaccharide deacetylase [Pseudonocardiaceae bacterium]|jgi:peptidoglycan/xylan/chitin deacetylase (PgdA/CDA1 family)|nr:polysaccharide deacetylase [Pseudonocardiaceae bacterium]
MATESYPWPGGARAALCVTFDFDGESPFLWRRRDDMPADIAELEQRRYGPRRGVHNVLEMLARLDIRATFFVPGWIAETYRSAVEAVAAAGHELALHGWCHEPPDALSDTELRDTLLRASELLTEIGGRPPVGYRSPSFRMTPAGLDVLAELGLRYDSSLMGDDRPYRIGELVEVPVDWVTDDAIYYRYTGGEARPPTSPADLTRAWRGELDGALRRGTLVTLTMHPWQSGRPARVSALADLLGGARQRDELWIGAVGDLAAHHLSLTTAADRTGS